MLGGCAQVLASAFQLKFQKLAWGDAEFEALAEALTWTRSLYSLNICGNEMGPRGARALAAVLPQCTSLCVIFIDGNGKLGDEGLAAFREVLPRLPSNHQFYCSRCGTSPEARKAMSEAYMRAGHKGTFQCRE